MTDDDVRLRLHRRAGRRIARALAAALAAAVVLVGCGSVPKTSRLPDTVDGRDGAEAHPPAGLELLPDAMPRVEPIRIGGPNKPYDVLGETYVPLTTDAPVVETGLASWYGRKFHGQRTSSGEIYNMYAMTAAHRTMPIPSYARVRNPANGREVIVRVNDRGPFARDRVVDLSYTAALKLGVLAGVTKVELERITYADIASGRWMRGDPGAESAAVLAQAEAPPTTFPIGGTEATPGLPVAAAGLGASTTPVAYAAIEAAPIDARDAPLGAAAGAVPAMSPDAAPTPGGVAHTAAARGFWVQLGAFGERDRAVGFQRRVADELAWIAPLLAIFDERPLHRLQAGPYASRDEARRVADRVGAALSLSAMVVERR